MVLRLSQGGGRFCSLIFYEGCKVGKEERGGGGGGGGGGREGDLLLLACTQHKAQLLKHETSHGCLGNTAL